MFCFLTVTALTGYHYFPGGFFFAESPVASIFRSERGLKVSARFFLFLPAFYYLHLLTRCLCAASSVEAIPRRHHQQAEGGGARSCCFADECGVGVERFFPFRRARTPTLTRTC